MTQILHWFYDCKIHNAETIQNADDLFKASRLKKFPNLIRELDAFLSKVAEEDKSVYTFIR